MAVRTLRGARGRDRVRCRNQVLTRGHAPQDGDTPLHVVAHMGHLEVARLLLKAGADMNAKDTVSERSVGDEGLGIRTRGGFVKNAQPWGNPRRPARNGQLLSGADK